MKHISAGFKGLLIGLLVVSVAGCSWFRSKGPAYANSQETRPLEVPPDLDMPTQSGALMIPQVAGSNADPAESAASKTQIKLKDSPAGSWRRVGFALERSELGEITERDEAASSYSIRLEPQGAKVGDLVTRKVRIVAEGAGSVIQIENESGEASNDSAAQRILTALKQRLG